MSRQVGLDSSVLGNSEAGKKNYLTVAHSLIVASMRKGGKLVQEQEPAHTKRRWESRDSVDRKNHKAITKEITNYKVGTVKNANPSVKHEEAQGTVDKRKFQPK